MMPRLQSETGFSLIELLVAMLILIVGVFGIVSAVDASRQLSDVSEHEDVAAQVADRELDLTVTVPFNSLALTQTPPTTGSPGDDNVQWNTYLTDSNLLPQPSGGRNCGTFWNSTTAADTTANDEPTCIVSCPNTSTPGCPSAGTVAPTHNVTVPVGSGQTVRLKVYRYVTWVNDTACGANCPNPTANAFMGDYKRVTIAVVPVVRSVSTTPTGTWPTGTGTGLPSAASNEGPRQPIVVSAVRASPDRGRGNNAGAGSPCVLGAAVVC